MNKTIHELNSLSQAEATDELIVYDVSEGESKKIQVQNLVGNPNYSTDETFTGQYWIDGKKIYRKYYNQSVATTHTWVNLIDEGNISSVIDVRGFLSGCVARPYLTRKYNSKIQIYLVGDSNWTIDGFVLEYTKTTE